MKNWIRKLLRREIDRLTAIEQECKALKIRLQFYEPKPIHNDPFLMTYQCGWVDPAIDLTAKEIISRFDEIYRLLGVERKNIPATPAASILEKKSKQKN